LIYFRCHECGQRYRAQPHWAGKSLRCKKCGVELTAPGIRQEPSAPKRRSPVWAFAAVIAGTIIVNIATMRPEARPQAKPLQSVTPSPPAVAIVQPEPQEPEEAAHAQALPSPPPVAALAIPALTGLAALLHSADSGNAEAMYKAGLAYEEGKGVGQDYETARGWYEEAANLGHSAAMRRLGWFYEEGKGVEQDYQAAMEWYMDGAKAGDPSSMNSIGRFYQHGKGVGQDYRKAAEWYGKAAAGGDAWGMNNLGWLYQEGKGVEQDYRKAIALYEKAAAAGNAWAMHNLGVLYANGDGVEQDDSKAIYWYEKAIKSGDAIVAAEARRNLELVRNEPMEPAGGGGSPRSAFEPWRNFSSAAEARQRDNFIRWGLKGGLPNQMPGARPR
jgi:TPR repeat protein